MGWFRILAEKDTWLTDKVTGDTIAVRATGSNFGRSPALNIFAAKDEISTGSIELANSLLKFNTTELSGKVFRDKTIPSASVTYMLKMFDMKHENTIPTSYDLFIYPMSQSWDEGSGSDSDDFRDWGWANWLSASSTQPWTTSGSDFITASYGSGSQHFDQGDENLEVDITEVVGNWLSASIGSTGLTDNGVVVKLGGTEESNNVDYYRKVFHGRESKFVDRVPYIEARWDDTLKDNRGNFAYDQDSKLYLYNFIRGELTNLTEPVIVKIQDNVVGLSSSFSQSLTASREDTGIYSASFNVVNTASFSASWVDVWTSASRVYLTGTFTPLVLTGSTIDSYDEYVVDVTNLKRVYGVDEEARLLVNVRKRDWKTHLGVLSSASLDLPIEYIEKMYYKIINNETGGTVVSFGTGSIAYTQLSYDGTGNYFNIDMKAFVPGFTYKVLFLIDINQYDKKVIDCDYVFKVI